jgi:hypothetical protein
MIISQEKVKGLCEEEKGLKAELARVEGERVELREKEKENSLLLKSLNERRVRGEKIKVRISWCYYTANPSPNPSPN